MSTKVYDSSSNSITEILDASEVSFIKAQGTILIIPKDDAQHIAVKEVITDTAGTKRIYLENGDIIEVSPAGPHTLIRNPDTVKAEEEAKAKADTEKKEALADGKAVNPAETGTIVPTPAPEPVAPIAPVVPAPSPAPGSIAGMQTSSNAPA